MRPLFLLLLTVLTLHAQDVPPAAKPVGFARWEPEISKMEAKLRASPPAPGGIVFAGSSSIRLWNLKESFPGLPVVNCGFGGSVIQDSTHFAPRLVIPLKPSVVVFYAGDNDSAKGNSAEVIAAHFKEFANTIHAALPDCRILYIPIKPSVARKQLMPLQKEANSLIEKFCQSQPGWMEYIDLATPLLTPEGQLRPELYRKDGLHLSEEGYRIWNKLLLPRLSKP